MHAATRTIQDDKGVDGTLQVCAWAAGGRAAVRMCLRYQDSGHVFHKAKSRPVPRRGRHARRHGERGFITNIVRLVEVQESGGDGACDRRVRRGRGCCTQRGSGPSGSTSSQPPVSSLIAAARVLVSRIGCVALVELERLLVKGETVVVCRVEVKVVDVESSSYEALAASSWKARSASRVALRVLLRVGDAAGAPLVTRRAAAKPAPHSQTCSS